MHERELEIPEGHKLVQIKSEWKQKKGQDTDTYWYEELDQEDQVVAKYIVKDSTSMYPPFKKNVTFDKFTPDTDF